MDGMGDGSDGMGFDMPMLMGQQPQLFGAYSQDSSGVSSILPGPVFQDDGLMGGNDDSNDAKRRRIARVCASSRPIRCDSSRGFYIGMRHVSTEEDKMRWQNAEMLPLHQL